jgi:tripartite-type tricarboxylate transporter receptor subunit TctC
MTAGLRYMHRLAIVAAVMLALGSQPAAWAQEYPTRPITLIAPWAAGGAVDVVARIIAPKLTDRLGKPVVVENRPGGGSTIGTALGAKAAADGYTLHIPQRLDGDCADDVQVIVL